MADKRLFRKIAFGVVAVTGFAFMSVQPSVAKDAPTAPEASPDVYKIIAENDQFRVIEARWMPGQRDNAHSHPGDRVSLFVTACKLRLISPDGTYRDASPAAGKAVVRTDKPVSSHIAQNIGDEICVLRLVELKQ